MEDQPTKVVGRRVVAFIIDGILIGAIQGVIFDLLAERQPDGDETAGFLHAEFTFNGTKYAVDNGQAGLFFLLGLLITLTYWVILPGVRGFTLGKLLLGLRLVKADTGRPPGVFRALVRQFLLIADAFPYFIPYLTGFIVALTSKRNQRIGDMVASTLVVRKGAVSPPGPLP